MHRAVRHAESVEHLARVRVRVRVGVRVRVRVRVSLQRGRELLALL